MWIDARVSIPGHPSSAENPLQISDIGPDLAGQSAVERADRLRFGVPSNPVDATGAQ